MMTETYIADEFFVVSEHSGRLPGSKSDVSWYWG